MTLRDLILAGADVWIEPDEEVFGRDRHFRTASSGNGFGGGRGMVPVTCILAGTALAMGLAGVVTAAVEKELI